MVSHKEGAVFTNRELLGCVGWQFRYAYEVSNSLQFTVLILWTEDTSLGYPDPAKTNVIGTAPLNSMTGETVVRVPLENGSKMLATQLLYPRRIGLDHLPIANRAGA